MRIEGQHVVITGATSGIGREVAVQMAEEGGSVVLLARTESKLHEVADRIRSDGGDAAVYPVDLAERDEIETTADQIRTDGWGRSRRFRRFSAGD
jgi:short-subunit dehydrogenase